MTRVPGGTLFRRARRFTLLSLQDPASLDHKMSDGITFWFRPIDTTCGSSKSQTGTFMYTSRPVMLVLTVARDHPDRDCRACLARPVGIANCELRV